MARQGARRRDGAAAPLFPRVASVAGVVFADEASCDRRCRPQRAVTQGKRGGELQRLGRQEGVQPAPTIRDRGSTRRARTRGRTRRGAAHGLEAGRPDPHLPGAAWIRQRRPVDLPPRGLANRSQSLGPGRRGACGRRCGAGDWPRAPRPTTSIGGLRNSENGSARGIRHVHFGRLHAAVFLHTVSGDGRRSISARGGCRGNGERAPDRRGLGDAASRPPASRAGRRGACCGPPRPRAARGRRGSRLAVPVPVPACRREV
jgi:hypothetical protein